MPGDPLGRLLGYRVTVTRLYLLPQCATVAGPVYITNYNVVWNTCKFEAARSI